MHLLALDLGAVADADDVELALEAVGHAARRRWPSRLRARPWNLLELRDPSRDVVATSSAVLDARTDARRHAPASACPSGPALRRASGSTLTVTPLGTAMGFFTEFVTSVLDSLPYQMLQSTSPPTPAFDGVLAGHHAARRRQDARAETAEHRRHVVAAEVDAAAGPADALDAGDHAVSPRGPYFRNDADRGRRLRLGRSAASSTSLKPWM